MFFQKVLLLICVKRILWLKKLKTYIISDLKGEDVDKLVPVDLCKLNDVVKNDDAKITVYDKLAKTVN